MPSRLAGVLAVLALSVPAMASAQSEPLPPQGTPPPGANDFSCKPSAKHPSPVILVHGTFLNMMQSWNTMAPALENLGYCVFALDYGNNATGDIPTSAGQLRTFVDEVLDKTGAAKVSLVGHSQGGMMPRYLIKFLGRSDKVDDLVGLSPSNHGTTNPLAGPAGPLCPACAQQAAGSDFINQLNAGDQTPAPVSYTVVQTSHDEVVTPPDSAFLPTTSDGRVTNVLIQDRCPADLAEHIAMPYDPVAQQWVANALGRPGPADPAFVPDCTALTPQDGGGGSGGGGGGSGDGGGGTPPKKAKPGRLKFGGVRRHRHRLHVAITVRGSTVKHVVVKLHHHGHVVGRAKPIRVAHKRVVRIKLKHRLRKGRLTARGKSHGRTVTAHKRFRLKR